MSGNCRCYLYVTNLTDKVITAQEPTDIQTHLTDGPNNVEPGQQNVLVVAVKGTSGTATGAHVEENLYIEGISKPISVSISCPFSSSNASKVDVDGLNNTPYKVTHSLRSPSGVARVYLVITDSNNDKDQHDD
ncbi:hypothetical protein L4D06_16800 [Enterovibrio makurazakiensis]|uniref:hypothetical protein n=1 Tax=Enterovibrio makurazakiensis TaxID=2910232 RepID=UPI003D1D41C8